MTEENVRKSLDFLCLKYNMSYSLGEYENYLKRNAWLFTYSYYNDFGCFTITNIPVVGDVSYYRLDSIYQISDILLDTDALDENPEADKIYSDNIKKHTLSIFDFEPEIWEKHKKTAFLGIPFFWGTDKQVLRALAEVIETQIQKQGSFFGIKVV